MKKVKGFKGFKKGLKCLDFQYKENETFEKEGNLEMCENGFHFCENPFDVWDYYNITDSEFATVEAVGKTIKDDDKIVTNKIKIGAKIDLTGFIKLSIDFLWEKVLPKKDTKKNNNKDSAKIGSSGYSAKIGSSGYSAQIGSSGYSAQIGSSGDYAKIGSSGDYAQIGSSGDSAQIGSSGYSAQIGSSGYSAKIGSSGDYAKIDSEGKHSVISGIGNNSIAKGKKGSWIVLAEWIHSEKEDAYIPKHVKSVKIDGKKIKEDTWYKLESGKFIEQKDV